MSVLLICVHYGGDDDTALDHFLHDLRDVLKRYARNLPLGDHRS